MVNNIIHADANADKNISITNMKISRGSCMFAIFSKKKPQVN